MTASIDDLANAVMSALYEMVAKAAGDIEDTDADDPFISWCKPGIPFAPEDFDFAKYMLIGQGSTEDERAADASRQMTQAAGFSRFVDFVPSVDGVVAGKIEGGVLRPGRATLSDVYKRILDASQVAKLPEPAGINEKIAALQAQAKPLEDAYMACQAAYEEAKQAYVMARLVASFSARDRLEFQAKGPGLKSKVNQARQEWEIDGSKTSYESLLAEIASLRSTRSPAIWRSEALARYDDLPEGQNATFGEARITMPYPGSFATTQSGWQDMSFLVSSDTSSLATKNRKWEAGGGFGWGSFKIGGQGGGSSSSTIEVKNTSNFKISMKVAQVSLLRNTWFDPWVLLSQFWRFNPASVEGASGDVVTDGAMPPKGLLIAYPISAIFLSGVTIEMDELKDESSDLVQAIKGGGGWGFGVLNVNGSYESNSETKTHRAEPANGVLTIPGLTLAGFVHELMGEARPKPKDGLVWVDGS
jgi:hypothetical protein